METMHITDVMDDLDSIVDDLEALDCFPEIEGFVQRLRDINCEILDIYKDNRNAFNRVRKCYDAH